MLENGTNTVMPVQPAGYGNGFGGGFGNDGGWWILLLFIILFGGWGGGYGGYGGGNGTVEVNNDVQRGFDQSAVMGSLGDLGAAVSNGFSNAEISRCNNTSALMAQLNNAAMQTAQGNWNTQSAVADVKATVLAENCDDRAALSTATRDIIENQNRNNQIIMDRLCQQEIDALKSENNALQTQINLAALQGSQAAQTAAIVADNQAQTTALISALNPAPIPAYVVSNPNGCGCGSINYGCGCGA